MAASSSFLSRGDSQTASNLLTVAGQGELALTRSAESSSVPFGLIVAQKNFSAALSLAIQASGLDDKEVYLSLGIDAGHWSRIRKGEAHFPMHGALLPAAGWLGQCTRPPASAVAAGRRSAAALLPASRQAPIP
jgi:hypothetical protein